MFAHEPDGASTTPSGNSATSCAQLRTEMRQDSRHLRQEMHAEFRDVRGDLAQMKLFMLGGLITILTAFIALHG